MILHRTTGHADWKKHLARPDLHWKPRRSAMETALAWEAQAGPPPEIAALFPGTRLLQAVVEYPVALPGGERDSQTDVFALFADEAGLIVCMVEAKRDEPFGPTVGEWLARGGAGRTERLAFLSETLGLDPAGLPPGLRYQLLHRTACAILTAQAYRSCRAAMVVQSFSPEHRWFDDFVAFAVVLGAKAERGRLAPARACGDCALALGWACAPFRSP
jgi:hypothetical protein